MAHAASAPPGAADDRDDDDDDHHGGPSHNDFQIRTQSNRADLISGGDALVEVKLPRSVPMDRVRLTLDGSDVGAGFAANACARTLRGVLGGLRVGDNRFEARSAVHGHGRHSASLTITNQPRGGPLLLSTQTQPWICATPAPVAPVGSTPGSNASGLSTTAVDAQCNIATEYKFFYRTTAATCSTALPDPSPPAVASPTNCFKPYAPGITPPDLAMTTTSDGLTVPFIVRIERGTLNRGIYGIVVLFDPSKPRTALMSALTQAQINAKKTAINGHLDQRGCHSWNNAFGFDNKPGNYARTVVTNQDTGALTPLAESRNNCLLAAALVYDPVTNPGGTRCGDACLSTAVWGSTDNELAPGFERARQTGDKVGVQYGLKALLAGAITAEEFVTLNEKIGGTDTDSNRTAARSRAGLAALPIAYRAGIVSSERKLGKLPIIDSRGYDEQGIHFIWRSFSERARIAAANHGRHANQVMWRHGTGLLPGTPAQVAAVTTASFLTMDTWLSSLLS